MKEIKSQAPHNSVRWEKFAGLLGLSPRATSMTKRALTEQQLLSSSEVPASKHSRPERDAPLVRVAAPAASRMARAGKTFHANRRKPLQGRIRQCHSRTCSRPDLAEGCHLVASRDGVIARVTAASSDEKGPPPNTKRGHCAPRSVPSYELRKVFAPCLQELF